ncbi:hypothetical protein ACQ4PT_027035 [Festuca glaucescens]
MDVQQQRAGAPSSASPARHWRLVWVVTTGEKVLFPVAPHPRLCAQLHESQKQLRHQGRPAAARGGALISIASRGHGGARHGPARKELDSGASCHACSGRCSSRTRSQGCTPSVSKSSSKEGDGKVDYRASLRLTNQDKHRNTLYLLTIVLQTNKDVTAQIVYTTIAVDIMMATAYSHEPPRYGLKVGLTNYATAYCDGLLLDHHILKYRNLDTEYEGNVEAYTIMIVPNHLLRSSTRLSLGRNMTWHNVRCRGNRWSGRAGHNPRLHLGSKGGQHLMEPSRLRDELLLSGLLLMLPLLRALLLLPLVSGHGLTCGKGRRGGLVAADTAKTEVYPAAESAAVQIPIPGTAATTEPAEQNKPEAQADVTVAAAA